jgi:hypothetical protein
VAARSLLHGLYLNQDGDYERGPHGLMGFKWSGDILVPGQSIRGWPESIQRLAALPCNGLDYDTVHQLAMSCVTIGFLRRQ